MFVSINSLYCCWTLTDVQCSKILHYFRISAHTREKICVSVYRAVFAYVCAVKEMTVCEKRREDSKENEIEFYNGSTFVRGIITLNCCPCFPCPTGLRCFRASWPSLARTPVSFVASARTCGGKTAPCRAAPYSSPTPIVAFPPLVIV